MINCITLPTETCAAYTEYISELYHKKTTNPSMLIPGAI